MATLDQIGDYEILNRIAHGGMGTVFLATHKGLRRHVALKVLSPQVNQDQEFIARFRREAQVIASLDHPHIVRVHDAGRAENYYYIAMEYLNYGTLKDRVKKFKEAGTPMPLVEVLEITRQIATALEHAHKKGVIHRDVKPSNIMIASGGRYVLTDFGIVFVQSGTRLTRSHGQLIGTAEYMSPEQADQQPYDHRVDIYALGVVMYELLTGSVPYTGDTEMVILYGHLNRSPKPINEFRDDVPRGVVRLIEKAMAKQLDGRFQTAGEMASKIECLIEHLKLKPGRPTTKTQHLPRTDQPVLFIRHRRRVILTMGLLMSVSLAVLMLAMAAMAYPAMASTLLERVGVTHSAVALVVNEASNNDDNPSQYHLPALKIESVEFVSASGNVPIRNSPREGDVTLGWVQQGEAILVTGKTVNMDWLQVRASNMLTDTGWVKVEEGRVNGNVNAVPQIPVRFFVTRSNPYLAIIRFEPRDSIGQIALSSSSSSKLVWDVHGAKSLELSITTMIHPGFNCPIGDLSSVQPLIATKQRLQLVSPKGEYAFRIRAAGYYLFRILVIRSDGSQTTLMRQVIVGCAKKKQLERS